MVSDQMFERFGVRPTDEIVETVIEDMCRFTAEAEINIELEERNKWIKDHSIVRERVKLKIRSKMIDLGYFPGTAKEDGTDRMILGLEIARSKMFNTNYFWHPINSQAAAITDFYQQVESNEIDPS